MDLFKKNKLILAIVSIILIPILAGIFIYFSSSNVPFRLINEVYDESDLVKWKMCQPSVSKPNEVGNLGEAVILTSVQELIATHRFKEHQFNIVANEQLSFNRTYPSFRPSACSLLKYPKKLPDASVIIIFHNEAWSTLIRTIWSVVTRTPRNLLHEIILVDDFSDKEYLQAKLYDYIKKISVRIVLRRTVKRVGLIRARLLGAKHAKGKVLIFLDAHCECSDGWSEPLIAQISKSRTSVVSPYIDYISNTNMKVKPAIENSYGLFNLQMLYTSEKLSNRDTNLSPTDLRKSPIMAGGLYAIDKEYFYTIGAYDDEMYIWGGENIEQSFRIWNCGGQLLLAPCSHVGHIFRMESPYVKPGGSDNILKNYARAVDIWLDEYKEMYYSVVPSAIPLRSDVSKRLELRKRLQCKSFDWYLKNIYPESVYNVRSKGIFQIENLGMIGTCLDIFPKTNLNGTVNLYQCHGLKGNQAFMLTESNQIRPGVYCIAATVPGQRISLEICMDTAVKPEIKWIYDHQTSQFKHSIGVNCLTMYKNNSEHATIEPCNENSLYQKWKLS